MTRRRPPYSEMDPLRLAQARASEYVCSECGLEAQVFSDLPGGYPYVRCPRHLGGLLERRQRLETPDGHSVKQAEIERERAEAKPRAPLPQTAAEWDKMNADLFG